MHHRRRGIRRKMGEEREGEGNEADKLGRAEGAAGCWGTVVAGALVAWCRCDRWRVSVWYSNP
jgi:hypothetical protein